VRYTKKILLLLASLAGNDNLFWGVDFKPVTVAGLLVEAGLVVVAEACCTLVMAACFLM